MYHMIFCRNQLVRCLSIIPSDQQSATFYMFSWHTVVRNIWPCLKLIVKSVCQVLHSEFGSRYVMFYLAFVCLFVCLSVWLLATSHKNYRSDQLNFTSVVSVDKELTKFFKSSASGSGSRNFLKDFQHCEIGHFPNLARVSGKMIESSWKFYYRCIFGQGSSVKFWKSSGSESELWIRTGFTLAEVCALLCSYLCWDNPKETSEQITTRPYMPTKSTNQQPETLLTTVRTERPPMPSQRYGRWATAPVKMEDPLQRTWTSAAHRWADR